LRLYQRADALVVLADGVRRNLIERGVPAKQITVVPNGSDPEFFQVTRPRAELRRAYHMNRMTFLYAGAHGPTNGLDLLIDAAAKVSDLDVEVVLLGDGISRAALRRRARDLALTNVRFLDPVPKNEVPYLLAAADVGVHCLADVSVFSYGISP